MHLKTADGQYLNGEAIIEESENGDHWTTSPITNPHR